MIQVTPQMRILVAVEPADFRKGIDGLARLCKEALKRDPFEGGVFVFRNRRGHTWEVLFDGLDNLIEAADPLGARVVLSRGPDHEVSRYTDPMGRYWDYVYDERGNPLSVTDQYGRGSQWGYDGLNNLTTYTDAVGVSWTLEYSDANHPTSPTAVREPPVWLGGPEAVTTASYYSPSYAPPGLPAGAWNGLVDTVTDPGGVTTSFEYDQWGQPSVYVEGGSAGRAGELVMNYGYNAGGWLMQAWNAAETTPECPPLAAISYDADGNVTGAWCPLYVCKDDRAHDRPYGTFGAGYDGMGRLEWLNNDVYYNPDNWNDGNNRDVAITYDGLGRPQTRTLTTEESGSMVTRAFDFVYDDVGGEYTVVGPDEASTVLTLDEAGGALMVEQEGVSAWYTYYPDGRTETVSRSNGTMTAYAYDFADLSMSIDHYNSNGALMLGLEYSFTTNGVVASITESDDTGQVAVTTFTHDARRRLTWEHRTGTQPYSASYYYDDNGNRTRDTVRLGLSPEPLIRNDYVYYGNRLDSYVRTANWQLIEEGSYQYDIDWNPTYLVRTEYTGGTGTMERVTEFLYDKMGRLWRQLEYEKSLPSGTLTCVSAHEFRYAAPRQRYLTRELDPQTLEPIPGASVWSDYNGNSIYADYAVGAGGAVTEQTRHLPGQWQTDIQTATTAFYHTNHLGTTRFFTDNTGHLLPDTARLYTAFGAPVTEPTSPHTRYGYAGAWGYQENDGLPFLHVGARYYDPSMGRFLQRDPIGIYGGLNVYAYVGNGPLLFVDPSGLMIVLPRRAWPGVKKWLEGPGTAGAIGAGTGAIMGLAKGAVTGGAAGAVAGGVGAGPGAVAGAIVCGMFGFLEGWGTGVAGWYIYTAVTAPPAPACPTEPTPERPSFWDTIWDIHILF